MKPLIYILLTFFLLTSCQQEETTSQGEGYLTLTDIAIQTVQVTPLSRAIHEELSIRILKNGEVYENHEYTSGQAPSGFLLPEGDDYAIEAYNSAYPNGEGAIYYAKETFSIVNGKQTKLSIKVPMINWGVCLSLPTDFEELFDDYTFMITVNDQSIELQNGKEIYFDYSEGINMNYSLKAINKDGEENESSSIVDYIEEGHIYKITYELPSRSLSISQ